MTLSPGKIDKERRVFHHTLYGQNLGATATFIDMQMDPGFVGSASGPRAINSPNPGFTHCVKLTHVFVDFMHGGAAPASNWTLSFYKNESGASSATFTVTTTGAAAVHQKTHGPIEPCLVFDPGDTYYIELTGVASVNVALARAILRFEEIGGP